MGNCQTSEAATILIERPDNRVDRLYFSVTAQEVMSSNPGHYLALVVTPTTTFDKNVGLVKRQLKLLRPSDTLLIGHVYRLISFEDVLKEFNGRKCVRMERLLKEREGSERRRTKQEFGCDHLPLQGGEDMEAGTSDVSNGGSSYTMNMDISSMRMNRQQWRPALQSISEVGS